MTRMSRWLITPAGLNRGSTGLAVRFWNPTGDSVCHSEPTVPLTRRKGLALVVPSSCFLPALAALLVLNPLNAPASATEAAGPPSPSRGQGEGPRARLARPARAMRPDSRLAGGPWPPAAAPRANFKRAGPPGRPQAPGTRKSAPGGPGAVSRLAGCPQAPAPILVFKVT
jgi:hypothetical protein